MSPGFEAFFGIAAATVREDATRILEQIHPEDRDVVSATTDTFATEREPTPLGPMLSIIVESFDGEIWHDPDAAEGATFRVAVPLHESDA